MAIHLCTSQFSPTIKMWRGYCWQIMQTLMPRITTVIRLWTWQYHAWQYQNTTKTSPIFFVSMAVRSKFFQKNLHRAFQCCGNLIRFLHPVFPPARHDHQRAQAGEGRPEPARRRLRLAQPVEKCGLKQRGCLVLCRSESDDFSVSQLPILFLLA